MTNINYDKFFLSWDEMFNWNCVSLDMKCKEFAFYGSVLLKKIFKEHNIKASVQVKKFFFGYTDLQEHYIIQIKYGNMKFVIDNIGAYDYDCYNERYVKCRYNKKQKLTIINCNDIKDYLKNENCTVLPIKDIINNHIIFFIGWIKKCFKD